jgi:hypothetical protein
MYLQKEFLAMIHIQGIPEVAARLAAARKVESLAPKKKPRGPKRPARARSAPKPKAA